MTLDDIGLTQDEIQMRVIDRICDRLLKASYFDEDGDETEQASEMFSKIKEQIRQRIDDGIAAVVEKHILPNAERCIESVTLQERTKWGSNVGEPIPFVDYLVRKGDEYMNEKVNFEGKSKSESSYGSWSASGTRLATMIHNHLHYSIESAMKKIMQDANSTLVIGLQETVKIKLEEIRQKLSVKVETGR